MSDSKSKKSETNEPKAKQPTKQIQTEKMTESETEKPKTTQTPKQDLVLSFDEQCRKAGLYKAYNVSHTIKHKWR